MSTFADAFRQGIASAEEVLAKKQEVAEIVDRMSQEIVAVTQGAIVKVEMKQLDRTAALLAHGRNGTALFLCSLQLDEQGYPVYVNYASRGVLCHDAQALQGELQRMLSQASIGENLRRLMVGEPIQ